MTELQQLLKIVQFETDLTIAEIAKELGYSREYLTRTNKKGENDYVVDGIKSKFAEPIRLFQIRFKPDLLQHGNVPNSKQQDRVPEPTPGQILAEIRELRKDVLALAKNIPKAHAGLKDIDQVNSLVKKGTARGKGK